MIASPWKITWDLGGSNELVIVEIDDRLLSSFGFPSKQSVAERKPIGAVNRDFLDRNHWETRIVFQHVKEHASWMAAQLFCAQHVADVQAVGRADLSFQYSDGAGGLNTIKVPLAVCEAVEVKPDDKKLRTIASYTFRGGAVEVV